VHGQQRSRINDQRKAAAVDKGGSIQLRTCLGKEHGEKQRALISSEPWTGFAFSFSLPTRKPQVLSMPRLMLIGLAPLVTACGQMSQL